MTGKIYLLWRKHAFFGEKKFQFFTRFEISNVCFSLFSYFRDLLFKSDSYQIEELSFAYLLVLSKEKFIFYGASMHSLNKLVLNFFTQIETTKIVFLLFLYFEDVHFKCESDQVEYLFYAHLLVVIKKNNSLWHKHVLLRKQFYYFFT